MNNINRYQPTYLITYEIRDNNTREWITVSHTVEGEPAMLEEMARLTKRVTALEIVIRGIYVI